jgi:Plasmid maintenance system antidote protein
VDLLQEILTVHNLNVSALARSLGLSKSYCSMLVHGQRPISKTVALKLRDQFGIPLDVSLCPCVHRRETVAANQADGER